MEELRNNITSRRHELRPQKPTDHYCKIAIGHTGIHLEWLVHAREKESFGVELHLERTTSIENPQLLEKIKVNSTEIEKRIGEQLVWQPAWTKRWSRVYAIKEIRQTPEFTEWSILTMIKFYDVFKPILDKIDT